MRTWHWQAVLWLSSCSAAWAQQPHIGYVYPAGGRQGTTFQVAVGGQYLAGAGGATISGGVARVAVVEGEKQLTMAQANEIREKVRKLSAAKPDAGTRAEIIHLQWQLARFMNMEMRRRANPAIGETVLLQITLAPDAEPGRRELRLETPRGVSNPLVFCVGRLPEFCEKEAEIPVEPRRNRGPTAFPSKPDTNITLPAVVNGRIIPREAIVPVNSVDRFTPGDVGRYRFEARKGQRLVAAASARDLIPYLADAVPGWFQATLALYDAKGKELAYDDDYRYHPDPVLFCTIPEDGQYVLEIKDALYRGRADFVYRIAVGELPFITSIFPLGGPAGRQTTVKLAGWNLPVGELTMDARGKAPGVYPLSVRNGDLISNTVPFAVDALPQCLEKEPNDSLATAQPVTLPVIVNGRVDRPGDWDVFRFEGRAGNRIVAEVSARRLDSPLDSVLRLTDAAGKQLAFNDDHEDRSDGLSTHHADSLIDFTLPADGTYYLHLGDAAHQGGPEYGYRLRISAPRPDFELRVVPSAINAVAGRLRPVTVFAVRKDGFTGDIALGWKDVPAGFSLSGGLLPAGQDQVRVTVTVPPMPSSEPVRVHMEGRATIAGREVVRTAVAADEMMQAFAYKHLVAAEELTVAVFGGAQNRGKAAAGGADAGKPAGSGKPANSGKPAGGGKPAGAPAATRRPFRGAMAILGDQPVKIPTGGTVDVRITAPQFVARSEIQVELSDPPEGIAVDHVSRFETGLAIVLRGDGKAKPGLKGNLIANVIEKRTTTAKDGRTVTNRAPLGMLPAIPFEVVK